MVGRARITPPSRGVYGRKWALGIHTTAKSGRGFQSRDFKSYLLKFVASAKTGNSGANNGDLSNPLLVKRVAKWVPRIWSLRLPLERLSVSCICESASLHHQWSGDSPCQCWTWHPKRMSWTLSGYFHDTWQSSWKGVRGFRSESQTLDFFYVEVAHTLGLSVWLLVRHMTCMAMWEGTGRIRSLSWTFGWLTITVMLSHFRLKGGIAGE